MNSMKLTNDQGLDLKIKFPMLKNFNDGEKSKIWISAQVKKLKNVTESN